MLGGREKRRKKSQRGLPVTNGAIRKEEEDKEERGFHPFHRSGKGERGKGKGLMGRKGQKREGEGTSLVRGLKEKEKRKMKDVSSTLCVTEEGLP